MIFEILIEDLENGPVSQEERVEWADRYGLTMPVLYDEGYGTLTNFATGGIGLPFTVILDQGVILDADYPGVDAWDELFE